MATIAVFGSSETSSTSSEWAEAEEIGRIFATAGHSVVTGGYGGTMEAVSKGAMEAGGATIGVTAPSLFPGRSGANRYVTELIEADSLADRIGRMVLISEGCVAMPGEIGTAAELLIAWNTNHIFRKSGLPRYPSVAVGPNWADLRATVVGRLGAFDEDIVWVDTGAEAASWLLAQIDPSSRSIVT